LHGTADIEQQERALKVVLHCFLLLAATQAHDLLNVVLHTSKLPQNIIHCFSGCGGWRDGFLNDLQLIRNTGFIGARARS
jgi:hypothetical protein